MSELTTTKGMQPFSFSLRLSEKRVRPVLLPDVFFRHEVAVYLAPANYRG
jgi:hypothetical protein